MAYHVPETHAVTKLSLAENGQGALWGLSLNPSVAAWGLAWQESVLVSLTSLSVQTYWNWLN